MGNDTLCEIDQVVDALDAGHARRVALLVLECHASLSDAIAAVELADRVVADEGR